MNTCKRGSARSQTSLQKGRCYPLTSGKAKLNTGKRGAGKPAYHVEGQGKSFGYTIRKRRVRGSASFKQPFQSRVVEEKGPRREKEKEARMVKDSEKARLGGNLFEQLPRNILSATPKGVREQKGRRKARRRAEHRARGK